MKDGLLSRRRLLLRLGCAAVVLLAVMFISPGVGSQPIGTLEAWSLWLDRASSADWSTADADRYRIAFGIRMPTSTKAMVAGFTLALAGAVFQTLFRNVLATPYTLGVAGGGALGALVAIKLGLVGVFLGLSLQAWFALGGASVVVAAVLLLAASSRRITGNTLVLAGVTIGFFCSAMMLFITYLADVRETFFVVRWMMGNLESVGMDEVLHVLPPLAVSWLVLFALAPSLNQFALGEDLAASRGVRPAHLQCVCIACASVGTALIVALCGPIGFVGLIVPQAARMVFGRDHRLLLPASALWGAVFLIVCDWLSRSAPVWYDRLTGAEGSSSALPIGVVTSIIGAPIFVLFLGRGAGKAD